MNNHHANFHDVLRAAEQGCELCREICVEAKSAVELVTDAEIHYQIFMRRMTASGLGLKMVCISLGPFAQSGYSTDRVKSSKGGWTQCSTYMLSVVALRNLLPQFLADRASRRQTRKVVST